MLYSIELRGPFMKMGGKNKGNIVRGKIIVMGFKNIQVFDKEILLSLLLSLVLMHYFLRQAI